MKRFLIWFLLDYRKLWPYWLLGATIGTLWAIFGPGWLL